MPARGPSSRRSIIVLVAAGLLVLILIAIHSWRFDQPDQAKQAAMPDTLREEPLVPVATNPGYLGPQACTECHAKRVAEFQETRHYLANCVPRPEIMPEGFQSGRGQFHVPDTTIRFEMSKSNGRFLQSTRWDAAESTAEIAFVYGAAGGNDEVYFKWRDDRLEELPMVWLGPQKTWGVSPFDRHAGGDFSREMTIRCVECHNTWFEHVPGSRNQYKHNNSVIGVTCEVCHGPGREHVVFHRDHPEIKQPTVVAQPAKLSRDRLMDLCAQCHSNALKHRGPAFAYRPGLPLDDFYVSMPTKHPEEDHVANQTTYLKQSKCFQKSETMTCVTCHDPHRPRSVTNAGSQSCLKCHAAEDCTDHDRIPAGVQGQCVSCHMPEHRKIQVFFRTEGDHYVAPVKRYEHAIGIYPLAREQVLLDWHRQQSTAESREEADRLSKQLGESWKQEAQQRRGQYRFLAAIDACRESLRFEDSHAVKEMLDDLINVQHRIDVDYQEANWHEREQRNPQAVEAYQRVLKAKPDFAAAEARLGTTYAVMGERSLAAQHLQSAAKNDPNDPYAPAMLGWLKYLDGQPEQALQDFGRAERVEPYSAKINHQMGLALAKLNRWSKAAERFEKAVTIDPKAIDATVGLSQALRRLGKTEEAIRYGRRAVQLSPAGNAEVLMNLAEAYATAGRWTDAVETSEKALSAAESMQPKLAPHIRIRLDELRIHQQK